MRLRSGVHQGASPAARDQLRAPLDVLEVHLRPGSVAPGRGRNPLEELKTTTRESGLLSLSLKTLHGWLAQATIEARYSSLPDKYTVEKSPLHLVCQSTSIHRFCIYFKV